MTIASMVRKITYCINFSGVKAPTCISSMAIPIIFGGITSKNPAKISSAIATVYLFQCSLKNQPNFPSTENIMKNSPFYADFKFLATPHLKPLCTSLNEHKHFPFCIPPVYMEALMLPLV